MHVYSSSRTRKIIIFKSKCTSIKNSYSLMCMYTHSLTLYIYMSFYHLGIYTFIQACPTPSPTRFLAQKTFVILKKGGKIKSFS